MTEPERLERFPTGIPGLDTLLHGGFWRGSVYLVQGPPGSGKTIMATHAGFNHARQGGRVTYMTTLTETHGRLVQYIRDMRFFDAALLPDSVSFVSGSAVLDEGDLTGMLDFVRREIARRKSSLFVIDGFFTLRAHADSDSSFRRFVAQLTGHASVTDTTVLLLTNTARGP